MYEYLKKQERWNKYSYKAKSDQWLTQKNNDQRPYLFLISNSQMTRVRQIIFFIWQNEKKK